MLHSHVIIFFLIVCFIVDIEMASPFKKIIVDDELNFFVRIAGYPNDVELLSVNGVASSTIAVHAQEQEPEAWKMFVNAMLPSILASVNAPLGATATVSFRDTDSSTKEVALDCPPDKSAANIAAIQQQYAAIIKLAEVSGLSAQDVGCVFNAVLAQGGGGGASGPSMSDMQDMMQGMGQNMASGNPQCQQQ